MGNNYRVLSESMLSKLNEMYTFKYNCDDNTIIVSNKTNVRTTIHDADKPFVILSKKFHKKILFNEMDLKYYKDFQKDDTLLKFSLFDIHNTVNTLRIIYQSPNYSNVVKNLKSKFYGLKEKEGE